MQQINTKIGERIRILRKSLKLTQEEFSGKADVERSYLAAIEKDTKPPSFNFVKSLIDTFDVNANWLLTGKGHIHHQDTPANCPEWLSEWWAKAGEKERNWLEIELKKLLRK